MIKLSLKEAERRLGRLIEEAAAGQEVVITSTGGRAVRVVPEGDLAVPPVEPCSPTLEGLLERINDENLHQEVETGPEVGDEVW